MRQRLPILALVAILVAGLSAMAVAQPPAKIRALLISGDDVGAHNWREISEATREVLVDSGRFDVKVCEDPLILESAKALAAYDVIVFTIYNAKVPLITPQAQENLLNYVKGGKGFFVQHLASASFKEWPAFGELCGRHWVMGKSGHGPRAVFTAEIVDAEHPIAKGLKDFPVDDELYAKLEGDEEIHVIVKADSDWSQKTEPLVFTRPYGEGRVVHNAFGHDRKAIMTPSVKTLIARGAEWAATGKAAQ
jgi:hypothetical protein